MIVAAQPLVSVVIPCYRQARYLGAAIESVRAQTYSRHEIIVVDDGSPDGTAQVAARHAEVKYIFQANGGTAAARNRGWPASAGDLLVFLDADDVLLPGALAAGVRAFAVAPEAAIVFGRCRLIAPDGSVRPCKQPSYRETDHYEAMLSDCRIWHPAAMMCRSFLRTEVGGFDESLKSCSDYDFYLRVARKHPFHGHNEVISLYRQHEANNSLNRASILAHRQALLRAQWVAVAGNRRYEKAYRRGLRRTRDFHGQQLLNRLLMRERRRWRQDAREMLELVGRYPRVVLRRGTRKLAEIIGSAVT